MEELAKRADRRYLEAVEHMRDDRFEEAIILFDEARGLDPSRTGGARHNCAIALRGLGRLDEALVSHDQAIELLTGNPLTHLSKGDTLVEQARQLHKIDVDGTDAELARDSERALTTWRDARSAYDRCLREDPTIGWAHHMRGVCNYELGRYAFVSLQNPTELEDAIADFERASRVMPDFATTHHLRGNALEVLFRLPEAAAAYDQSLELEPGNMLVQADRRAIGRRDWNQTAPVPPREE